MADAIVSMEFYLETVQQGRGNPLSMLDNAEACVSALGSRRTRNTRKTKTSTLTGRRSPNRARPSPWKALPRWRRSPSKTPPEEPTIIKEVPTIMVSEGDAPKIMAAKPAAKPAAPKPGPETAPTPAARGGERGPGDRGDLPGRSPGGDEFPARDFPALAQQPGRQGSPGHPAPLLPYPEGQRPHGRRAPHRRVRLGLREHAEPGHRPDGDAERRHIRAHRHGHRGLAGAGGATGSRQLAQGGRVSR